MGERARFWKLATTEGSRGFEIQNQLLDDMKAEFQEFPGRSLYTDVEREGAPPQDVDRPPAAPRTAAEEEYRASALVPTMSLSASPPPSLPELDIESQRSLQEALRSEAAAVPVLSSNSSHPISDRGHHTTSQGSRDRSRSSSLDVLARETEEQWEPTEERQLGNQVRERSSEHADEPLAQRPRPEGPACAIRWSKADEPGHWVPVAVPDVEEDMCVEADPEVLWQQHVDDHISVNILAASLSLPGGME